MATIEERAKRYTNRNGAQYLSGFEQAEYDAYIKGATEQKAIDDEEWRKDMRYLNIQKQALIDKACEWFLSQIDYDNTGRECRVFFRDAVDRFRKAMEE